MNPTPNHTDSTTFPRCQNGHTWTWGGSIGMNLQGLPCDCGMVLYTESKCDKCGSNCIVEVPNPNFGKTGYVIGTGTSSTAIGKSAGTNMGTQTFSHASLWGQPSLIKTIVNEDSIELIYKQFSMTSNNFGMTPPRIYKIVCSCKDGKWHKSEPIEGQIIEATEESYEFNEG